MGDRGGGEPDGADKLTGTPGRDVVMLTIGPRRVKAEIRVEELDGGGYAFPHIYGPLPLDAVTSTDELPVSDVGDFA